MKIYRNIFRILILLFFTISCNPALVLFVKNNTKHEKEIVVELKEKKLPKELLFCKELVEDRELESKAFIEYYRKGKCYHENINALNENSYRFILPPNFTVNIVPNNSIDPYKKIYYLINKKECLINVVGQSDCHLKISQQPRLVKIVEIQK